LEGLTPGDFKAVLMRTRYSPGVEAEALLCALADECRYKEQGKRIGFS